MENQRVRLTKTMLKSALIRLLKDKGMDKITIYELCQEAEINRTTFYKYYGNQHDLLSEIENDLFETLNTLLANVDPGGSEGLTEVFKIFQKEKEQMRVLINSVPDEDFTNRLFYLPIIVKLLRLRLPDDLSESQTTYYYTFFCHGGYAMIRKWLNEEDPCSPEELARLLSNLSTIFVE